MRLVFVFVLLLSLSGLIACDNSPKDQENLTAQNTLPPSTGQPTAEPLPEVTIQKELPEAGNPEKNLIKDSEAVTSSSNAKAIKVAEKIDISSKTLPAKIDEEVKEEKTPVRQPEELPASRAVTPENQEKSQIPEAIVPEKLIVTTADHSSWDALLRKYVTVDGKVNYNGLKSDQAKLQTYLDELANHPVQTDWSKAEKMAYWINAYNAFTVKLIVDNYPVSSITNLHNGKPWDVKWIKLGDKTYSLNQIENEILRPQFKDARIHFAVNCAAKSCPPLMNRAWTAENLNSSLDQRAKAFVNNSKFNTLQAKKVSVSKIFDWYSTDFSDLIGFLNKYSETSINSQAEVTYQEYDWALNN